MSEMAVVVGLVVLLVGIGLGVGAGRVFGDLAAMERRIGELETQAANQAAREAAGPVRHTIRTAAGIEDALAVNLDLSRCVQELELELGALRHRAGQQAEILRQVRGGPQSYDPERPAGKRKSSHKGTEDLG